MSELLSVVVPVHNAEQELARQVSRVLEVVSDLTSEFEVLIVDDGSTDHTTDCAHELRRQFPQLRIIRHHRRRGLSAVVQDSLRETRGRFVYVHDEVDLLPASALRRLWAQSSSSRHTKQLMWGSVARRVSEACEGTVVGSG